MWQACGLDRRWSDASARGGPVGAAADRDLDAVLALFDAAARFADRLPGADIATFTEYLAEQQLPGDSLADRTPRRDAVELLTAHAARGREWDVVAVPGVQEGAWPDLRLRGSLLGNERLVDLLAGVAEPTGATVSRVAPLLAEERRLFYVACTRARHTLLVSAVQGEDEQPSRFLDELDPLPAGQADRPVHRPGRALVLAELVGELRRAACAPDGPDRSRERRPPRPRRGPARPARGGGHSRRPPRRLVRRRPGVHRHAVAPGRRRRPGVPLRRREDHPLPAALGAGAARGERRGCARRGHRGAGARTGPGRGGGRGHRRAGRGAALGLGAARRGRPVVLPPRAHPGARHARRVRQLGAGQPGRGAAAGRGRAAGAARPGRRGRRPRRGVPGCGCGAGSTGWRSTRRAGPSSSTSRPAAPRSARAPRPSTRSSRSTSSPPRSARSARSSSGARRRAGPGSCTSPTSAPTARPRSPLQPPLDAEGVAHWQQVLQTCAADTSGAVFVARVGPDCDRCPVRTACPRTARAEGCRRCDAVAPPVRRTARVEVCRGGVTRGAAGSAHGAGSGRRMRTDSTACSPARGRVGGSRRRAAVAQHVSRMTRGRASGA